MADNSIPYTALARQWRPQTFEEVVGQEHVTRTLMNAIRKDKVHHAFLFTGTRGVGKTTVARILAKALCCKSSDGPTSTPCNECDTCREITNGSSVDVHEIDGASNRGIDDIRDLQQNVMYSPQKARYRIYIIDEVHMLTKEAFNALLKTLEEPPGHVKFIFATTESNKILPTILSRCQRYDFKMISAGEIAHHLQKKLEAGQIDFSEDALRLVARYARGSMRDAQSLLDRVLAFVEGKLEADDVRMVLGVADRTRIYELTRMMIEKDGGAVLDLVEDINSHGVELKQFAGELLEHIRNGIVAINHPQPEKLLDLPDAEVAELKRQIKAQPSQDVWIRWFDILYSSYDFIARGAFDRLMFETALIKMLHVTPVRPIDDLVKSVQGLLKSGGAAASRPAPPQRGGSRPRSMEDERSSQPPDPPMPPEPPEDMQREEPDNRPTPIPIESYRAKQPKGTVKGGDFKRWVNMVSAFKERDRTLWIALREAEFISWNGSDLQLAASGAPRIWNVLGTQTNQGKIQEILQEISGEPVNLDLRQSNRPGAGRSVQDEEREQRQEEDRSKVDEALNDPTVRAIREMFGGGEVVAKPLENEENFDESADDDAFDDSDDEAMG